MTESAPEILPKNKKIHADNEKMIIAIGSQNFYKNAILKLDMFLWLTNA